MWDRSLALPLLLLRVDYSAALEEVKPHTGIWWLAGLTTAALDCRKATSWNLDGLIAFKIALTRTIDVEANRVTQVLLMRQSGGAGSLCNAIIAQKKKDADLSRRLVRLEGRINDNILERSSGAIPAGACFV